MKKCFQKHYGIFFSFVIIFLFFIYILYDCTKIRQYYNHFTFIDMNISVKIYHTNTFKVNQTMKKIKGVIKDYEKIISHKSIQNKKNIYYIKHNKSKEKRIKIDEELYNILSYAKKIYMKYNRLNINTGQIISLCRKEKKDYKNINETELEKIDSNMDDLILFEDGTVLNNHLDLDVSYIIRGYMLNQIKKELKRENINMYIINIGGTIITGKHYNKGLFQIALKDTFKNSYYNYLQIENKALATRSIFEEDPCNYIYYDKTNK